MTNVISFRATSPQAQTLQRQWLQSQEPARVERQASSVPDPVVGMRVATLAAIVFWVFFFAVLVMAA